MLRIALSCLLLLVSLTPPHQAFAQEVTFRVIGAQGKVLFEELAELSTGSLGEASHTLLSRALRERSLHQYQGSSAGVTSVNELGSALEVLSDTQMNAYGWCYRVDGEISNLLAEQYRLTGSEQQIEWFYAYAHLERNDWTSMCVPADHKPAQN